MICDGDEGAPSIAANAGADLDRERRFHARESALKSLIERVEAASGPDRELDTEVFRAIGAPVPFQWFNKVAALSYDEKQKCWIAPIGDMQLRYEPPHYTASLDAVMALMPEGHTYDIGDCNEDNLPWACVTRMSGDCPDYAATGATVVLAWISAILQARLAMEATCG